MSRRKAYYLKYLESGHWKRLRQEAFERDGYLCCHCHKPKSLRGHHIKYRTDLTTCTVDDIVSLCEGCHNNEHNRLKQVRKWNRRHNPETSRGIEAGYLAPLSRASKQ